MCAWGGIIEITMAGQKTTMVPCRQILYASKMLRELVLGACAAICCLAQSSDALSILSQRCMPCHSGGSKQSRLDLSSRDSAIRGGARGPAIVPGKAQESLLFRVASHAVEPHMPLKSPKLAEAELTALSNWIDKGAAYEHWSFRKPKRTAVPAVPGAKGE